MTRTSDIVAKAVNVRLTTLGKTDQELAQFLGVSRRYIVRRNSLETPWSIDELDRVAKFLGMGDGFSLLSFALEIEKAEQKASKSALTAEKAA
ncbi:helix-turn-helix domain-containing protein [Bifidobacterium vansinderenii]|uniref:HTH cro/C1-type domain-containing protein n=1 Tax=Bifidobacterium vansinderenii TaxID=1984871 RepID=A0A229VWB1_9BIFI|nr:hypothetical protein [Bifidobacterium vansinderenii]OXM99917.1 hypothetical protein Tam10B_1880 [Bifidobacterium vansinderenii]